MRLAFVCSCDNFAAIEEEERNKGRMHQNGALGVVSEERSGKTNFDVSLGIDAPPATALSAPNALTIASTRILLILTIAREEP